MDFQQGYLVVITAQQVATTNTFALARQHTGAYFRSSAQVLMQAAVFLPPAVS